MIDGTWDETEFLIVEAEKIVRLRGLMRRGKSRKVRMLHHCYVYLRVFHESLSLPSMQSNQRLTILDTLERTGSIPAGQDNLSFHVRSWSNLSEQFQVSKDQDFGENDLHLSVPGLWPPTLYPEIFGVSEIWLMLLSQVIRLSNEKDLPARSLGSTQLSIKEYTKYAKSLEMLILQWENSAAKTIDQIESKGDQAMDVDWLILEAMHAGLRHSLAIYFYRRIYDVEPEVLQPHVEKVKESLSVCNQFYETSRRPVHGLLWSAFIAGCEAIDVELQNWFLQWIDANLTRNPISLDARMRKVMLQVWEQRRLNPTASVTWLNVFQKIDDRAVI
jgi:arginine metabolism regulation protein II